MLVNVLGNSFKFTPEKWKVDLIIIQENYQLIMKVSDNGVWIDPKDHEVVFEKFWQAESSNKKWVEWTWLWLPLVKLIIEKLWWKVSIESDIGKWTTFIMEMPLIDHLKEEE